MISRRGLFLGAGAAGVVLAAPSIIGISGRMQLSAALPPVMPTHPAVLALMRALEAAGAQVTRDLLIYGTAAIEFNAQGMPYAVDPLSLPASVRLVSQAEPRGWHSFTLQRPRGSI